jgi:RimJ/RimL family protein N-acetyltransferase
LCVLRPWQRADAASLVYHANNINVAQHLRDRFPHPYTMGHATAFLSQASHADPPASIAIEVEGAAAGGIGYVRGTDVERFSAEVGYWLGEDHWGRGIATEALSMFTRHLFSDVRLLRLFALPLAENTGSIRVLEKAGYTCEGLLRASCVKYGLRRDQWMYACINPSWPDPGETPAKRNARE